LSLAFLATIVTSPQIQYLSNVQDDCEAIPYYLAETYCEVKGLNEQFIADYGDISNWYDPEFGPINVDLGEFIMWVYDQMMRRIGS